MEGSSWMQSLDKRISSRLSRPPMAQQSVAIVAAQFDANTLPSTTSSFSTTTNSTSSAFGTDDMDGSVAIVFGVLGLVAIGFLIFAVMRNRKRNKDRDD